MKFIKQNGNFMLQYQDEELTIKQIIGILVAVFIVAVVIPIVCGMIVY